MLRSLCRSLLLLWTLCRLDKYGLNWCDSVACRRLDFLFADFQCLAPTDVLRESKLTEPDYYSFWLYASWTSPPVWPFCGDVPSTVKIYVFFPSANVCACCMFWCCPVPRPTGIPSRP